jgi:hypothetical protein
LVLNFRSWCPKGLPFRFFKYVLMFMHPCHFTLGSIKTFTSQTLHLTIW